MAVLDGGVAAAVRAAGHTAEPEELAAFVRGDDGVVTAGVYGWTWAGCCEVQYLWVHESLRRAGTGTALMAWAEGEAGRRGCSQVVVFTHAAVAGAFYARRGYTLAGRVDGYPRGDAALWYRKVLPGPGLTAPRP